MYVHSYMNFLATGKVIVGFCPSFSPPHASSSSYPTSGRLRLLQTFTDSYLVHTCICTCHSFYTLSPHSYQRRSQQEGSRPFDLLRPPCFTSLFKPFSLFSFRSPNNRYPISNNQYLILNTHLSIQPCTYMFTT